MPKISQVQQNKNDKFRIRIVNSIKRLRHRIEKSKNPDEIISLNDKQNKLRKLIRKSPSFMTESTYKKNKRIKDDILFDKLTSIDDYNIKLQLNKKITRKHFKELQQFVTLKNQGNDYHYLVWTLEDGNQKYIPLSQQNFDKGLKHIMTKGYLEEEIKEYGSDVFDKLKFDEIVDMRIVRRVADKPRKNKNGKFFNYLNGTVIDLTRYQIIKEDDDFDILKEHCFIHTLKMCGISEEKISNVKTNVITGCNLSRSNFDAICDMIETKIVLHNFRKDEDKITKSVYGKKYENEISMALYKDHYFIYELTKFNKYYIKNYRECVKQNYNTNIYKVSNGLPRYCQQNYRKIDSLQLVKTLFDSNHFYSSELLDEYNSNPNSNQDITLNVKRQRKVKTKPTEPTRTFVFYADCESDVVSNINHTPIMIGVVSKKSLEPTIFTLKNEPKNLFYNFMKHMADEMIREENFNILTDKIKVYFHNMKYDYRGLLQKYCCTKKAVVKDGNYYCVDVVFGGFVFSFVDSYKLMPEKLSKFPEIFELDKEYTKKEAIGYTYHTISNINKNERILIDEYLPHIHRLGENTIEENPEKIKEEFISILSENAKEFEYYDGKFNACKYYRYYLKYDVLVLKNGIEKYVDILHEVTATENGSLNLHDFLTISSLTDNYMKNNGAYEGIYEMSGSLREFCSRAIQGGRVNVCKDFKKQRIEEYIEDFDGVSLYPSAIYRLCREYGLPKGKAKIIESFHPIHYNYYIAQITLKKINKKQQNSFIGIKNKDGILEYINKVSEPLTLYVDKFTLEDYIKFHEIEYDFVKGVYWDEGYNKKMGGLIKNLFDARLKYKSEKKEALQQVVKLMMNSAYGKTIIKSCNTKTSFVQNKYINDYVCNNFNTIKEFRTINDYQTEVNSYSYDKSYNRSHIGGFILSMSKRIMNEVMNTANDNGINVYYTDTDSMHIKSCDIPKLQEEYNKSYNRKLIGKQLGQFHGDFSMKGSCGDILSIQSVFLGKKCYVDKLKSIDKNGNEIYGYHCRMKGVSEAGLKYECDKSFGGDYIALYEHLAKGNTIRFILNPLKSTVSFEYQKSGGISTRKQMSFYRDVKF